MNVRSSTSGDSVTVVPAATSTTRHGLYLMTKFAKWWTSCKSGHNPIPDGHPHPHHGCEHHPHGLPAPAPHHHRNSGTCPPTSRPISPPPILHSTHHQLGTTTHSTHSTHTAHKAHAAPQPPPPPQHNRFPNPTTAQKAPTLDGYTAPPRAKARRGILYEAGHSPPSTPARPTKRPVLRPTPAGIRLAKQKLPPANDFGLTQEEILAALSDTQSKSQIQIPIRGLMCPGKIARSHPAGPLLQSYAEDGCPVIVEGDWTLEQLDSAVEYGAHPSAEKPEAAQACRKEALEKVEQGFAKLVPYSQLRRRFQLDKPHTKASPIAAIPHKSRLYRMILDLSRKGQGRKGQLKRVAVNDLTKEDAAPLHSMSQLGKVLPRFIYTLATAPDEDGPILLCKLDIKDGFWRMCVPEKDEEQFCYVLPKADESEEIMMVVPAALQMGWVSSPPYFCAATETGRDVAELLRAHAGPNLPEHPMEHDMIDPMLANLLKRIPKPSDWTEDQLHSHLTKFQHLFEVYVDDFCALVQSTDEDVIRHHSRALLHAIHEIFPPPEVTGHAGENPISQQKLVEEQEGVWAIRKEILGWIFDGLQRTMELPTEKVDKLRRAINNLLRHKHCDIKEFQSIVGKLQHAAMGIPAGQSLLAPLFKALQAAGHHERSQVTIHAGSSQAEALRDFRTLLTVMSRRPTHCRELISGMPAYIGFCDACKYGAGGVWFSGSQPLHPIVWRVKWPDDIVNNFVDNGGRLTINDLEMAGMLLHYMILEQIVDLRHTHTGSWCDNKSSVSWITKMSCKSSLVGQQLTRALALRHCANESSPMVPLSISGKNNGMADLSSRSFRKTGAAGTYNWDDLTFLTHFNERFPLEQGALWLTARHHNKLLSRVFSLLRSEQQPMGSWIRLPKSSCDIGRIGSGTVKELEWTRSSMASHSAPELTSSWVLPRSYARAEQDEDIRSELARFRTRFAPSARPSNWTTVPTPSTATRPTSSTTPGSTGR